MEFGQRLFQHGIIRKEKKNETAWSLDRTLHMQPLVIEVNMLWEKPVKKGRKNLAINSLVITENKKGQGSQTLGTRP